MSVSDHTAIHPDGTSNPLREESIRELMKQLATESSTLVRQELQLARAETVQQGREAGKGLGMIGGAGVMTLLALGTLTAAIVIGLDAVMPLWAAALVVTVAYLAIAGVLALMGKDKVHEAIPPVPQTVDTVKEDVTWARTQMRSAGK